MRYGSRPSLNPQKLRSSLHEMFRRGYEQHDCAEFMRILLDQLETASKLPNSTEHIANNFVGTI